jgi:hypothetical protein
MTSAPFVLNNKQRAEIMRAVKAIEHQLTKIKADSQTVYVISSNLAIIHMNVADVPRAGQN